MGDAFVETIFKVKLNTPVTKYTDILIFHCAHIIHHVTVIPDLFITANQFRIKAK